MKILNQILIIILLLNSCKKQLIRNEPIFNDLISEIIDTTELNTIDSLTNKKVIGYRKSLIYPIPSDLEAIIGVRNYLGHILKSEKDSINFLEPLENLIKRKKSDSYAIEVDSLNTFDGVEVLSFEKIKNKYPNKKAVNSSIEVLRDYFFSNIYFDSNGTKGVFYSSYLCGGNCGQGELIFVEFRNKKWTIVNRVFLWVA